MSTTNIWDQCLQRWRNAIGSKIRRGLVFFTMFVVSFNYFVYHHESRGPSFHANQDDYLLWGLAFPFLLLSLAALIWNPSTSTRGTGTVTMNVTTGVLDGEPHEDEQDHASMKPSTSQGDVNVQKWTLVWFVLPLILICLDGAVGHFRYYDPQKPSDSGNKTNSQDDEDDDDDHSLAWDLYIRFCTGVMGPSGYAAAWALALFLIPVTKHSPILDWMQVTPVQALAFHRIAGWTSLLNTILHGFTELRYSMVRFNASSYEDANYTWQQKMKLLLVPASKCFTKYKKKPWDILWNKDFSVDDCTDGSEECAYCWLAIINATGMVSTLAFIILGLTSLPHVRRYSYKLFYRVHIPAAWIMLAGAIWHIRPCALLLIPNIIYYLSLNIPVYVSQRFDRIRLYFQCCKTNENNGFLDLTTTTASPLIEANLIQGGSIELIFVTRSEDLHRHESRYVRLFHPSVSPLSHPFSIFSRNDLLHSNVTEGGNRSENTMLQTFSILLRPKGAFTEGLTKALFRNHDASIDDTASPMSSSRSTLHEYVDGFRRDGVDDAELLESLLTNPGIDPSSSSTQLPNTSSPSSHDARNLMMTVDSYYGASFGWVDGAMKSHDEILLVAGGVGIVPFLEFLPSLQQRIQMDSSYVITPTSTAHSNGSFADHGDNEVQQSECCLNNIGPEAIHLHWYCRDIGLASYVWHNHLRPHVEGSWGSDPTYRDRLKIHIHLTSFKHHHDVGRAFKDVPHAGLKERQTYSAALHLGQVRPVQDAHFTQNKKISLIVPGAIMAIGITLHWWWYKHVDREGDNILLRTHSIIFAIMLAFIVSIPMEYILRFRKERLPLTSVSDSAYEPPQEVENEPPSTNEHESYQSDDDIVPMVGLRANNDNFGGIYQNLIITAGRPTSDSVIQVIMAADRPGLYSCGPRAMMESIEDAMAMKRSNCAYYREESEL